MADRFIRDTVVAAKIHSDYATDPVPAGGANAMQVSNLRITELDAQYVPRDLIRGFFGGDEELMSFYKKLVSFDVEAVGSGTAGTAPAWGPLLRACGWAQTLTASERATYTPVTNSQEAVGIYVDDSGVLHKLLGARGTVSINMTLGTIPKLSFAFVALDGGSAAGTLSGVDFSAFMTPQVVQNAFTGDLTLGCTLKAPGEVPALVNGDAYPSTGIEIDTGVRAEHIPLLGSETVPITGRDVKGKIKMDVTVAQQAALYDAIKATTLNSLGLIHGTVVGRRFGIFGGQVQFKSPTVEDMQGKRMSGYDLGFKPTQAGNDELTIVTSF
ncbi:MAG: hypothetical protein AB7P37_03255 [Ramlibacter sp.]